MKSILKSHNFSKFISFFVIVFILIGTSPSSYFAKGNDPIAGFANPVLGAYRYYGGTPSVNWVNYETDYSWVFRSDPSRLDYSSLYDYDFINMFFSFTCNLNGSASVDAHANLYQKSFNWNFTLGCINANNGQSMKLPSIAPFSNIRVMVIYQDNSRESLSLDNILFQDTTGGISVSVSFSGFADKLVKSVVLYLEFNFHAIFKIDPSITTNNSMFLRVGNFTWKDTTPQLPAYDDVPTIQLPGVDTDGLPIIDDFLPSEDNIFISTIRGILEFAPISMALLLVASLGLTSYVLFGKR